MERERRTENKLNETGKERGKRSGRRGKEEQGGQSEERNENFGFLKVEQKIMAKFESIIGNS